MKAVVRQSLQVASRGGKSLGQVIRETWTRYEEDHGDVLSAGLAFYSLMSAAPLAWLVVTIASALLEKGQALAALSRALELVTGPEAAEQIVGLTQAMQARSSGTVTWIALGLLLWAASRLFVQLQSVLNVVWGIRRRSDVSTTTTIKQLLLRRATSLLMVFSCGVLLLTSVLLHALVSAMWSEVDRLIGHMGVSLPHLVLPDIVLSIGMMTLGLGATYRLLPDARIPWRHVWVGALTTAVLMAAGTALLTYYLGRPGSTLLHGALGSAAAFALWAYYLCQVFVVGAAFTYVWSVRRPGDVIPEPYAEFAPGRAPG